MGGVGSGSVPAGCEAILSGEALEFVADLQRTFGGRREELLGGAGGPPGAAARR